MGKELENILVSQENSGGGTGKNFSADVSLFEISGMSIGANHEES